MSVLMIIRRAPFIHGLESSHGPISTTPLACRASMPSNLALHTRRQLVYLMCCSASSRAISLLMSRANKWSKWSYRETLTAVLSPGFLGWSWRSRGPTLEPHTHLGCVANRAHRPLYSPTPNPYLLDDPALQTYLPSFS